MSALPFGSSPSIIQVVALGLISQFHEIGLHHLRHQIVKFHTVTPSKFVSRLRRVAAQLVDLGRPEVSRVYRDEGAPVASINPLLRNAGAMPLDFAAGA